MDKIDQLFIRACKANDPVKRLTSVYKRFYTRELNCADTKYYMTSILLDAVDRYGLIGVHDLVIKMSPRENYLHEDGIGYYDKLLEVLMRKIRYTDRLKLDQLGVSIPLRFKGADKNGK